MSRTALFVGASGLIGRQAIKEVLRTGNYTKIISIGRRISKFEDDIPQENLIQKIVDFEKIEDSIDDFRGVNDVLWCMGSSVLVTGNAATALVAERDYLRNTAKLIAEANKSEGEALIPIHILYCSGMGASKDSSIDIIRVKGENEEYFAELGFKRVSVFRTPFVKVTEQREKPRMIETVFSLLAAPVSWLFKLKIYIPSDVVGKSLSRVAADTSIKPLDPKDIKTSNSGSVTYAFSGADMLDMEAKAKQ